MPSLYNTVFGGNLVAPAIPTYLPLNMSANVILGWPLESNITSPAAAEIIDVTATAPGLTIQLSDARQISTGYCALFNNVGANTVTVLDAQGNVLMTPASGQAWQIYLADNSTLQGTWRTFQYGAGTSSATAASLAGAGLIAITTTLNENIVIKSENTNYTFLTADRATCIEWTGGTGTGTLPVAGGATAPSGWFVLVKNNGSGIWTISGQSGATIDGSASLALNPEQSCFLITDGTNWITLGLGQQLNSIFDFVSISLTGQASPFVLSGVNLNRVSYKFTGVLTANMVVQVPNTIQQYWVDNETTGAFTLTVATPSGGGALTTPVAQGTRNILYSDGTNVVPAVTFSATGFVNGTAAIPSIFFTASPTTGFYSPGANQLAATTAGVERMSVDATGHWTFLPPDTTGVGYTFNQSGVGSGITAKIVSPFSSAAVSPLLQLQSTAVNGFATLSLCGNSAAPGTNDFALFSSGSGDAGVINRSANNALNISASGAGGSVNIQVNGSTVATFLQAGTASAQIGSAAALSIAFTNTTASSAGTGGATALPANPAGYLTVLVNGGSAKIPYYNN